MTSFWRIIILVQLIQLASTFSIKFVYLLIKSFQSKVNVNGEIACCINKYISLRRKLCEEYNRLHNKLNFFFKYSIMIM